MYQITIPTRQADFSFERGDKLIDIGNQERPYTESGTDLIITGDSDTINSILSLGIKIEVQAKKLQTAPAPTPDPDPALTQALIALAEARDNANRWARKYWVVASKLHAIEDLCHVPT